MLDHARHVEEGLARKQTLFSMLGLAGSAAASGFADPRSLFGKAGISVRKMRVPESGIW